MTYSYGKRKQRRRINRKFVKAGFSPRTLEPGERKIAEQMRGRPFTSQELGLNIDVD